MVLSHSYFDLKNVILVVENNKTPNVKKEDIYKIINESLNGTALNTDLEKVSLSAVISILCIYCLISKNL